MVCRSKDNGLYILYIYIFVSFKGWDKVRLSIRERSDKSETTNLVLFSLNTNGTLKRIMPVNHNTLILTKYVDV